MMETKFLFVLTFVLFFSSVKSYSFDDLLFKPLTANHLESRIGFFYQPDTENLRLDIGHSLDLYEFINNEKNVKNTEEKSKERTINEKIRIGGDFFILSRLRSDGRMKFPVETSDFYFGLNASGILESIFSNIDCSFRLRVGHISSHLVDGYTFQRDDTIFFRKKPFVYSREFIDLILACTYQNNFRCYMGCTYIFSTIPHDVNKFVPQIGFDYQVSINKFIDVVGGYDFKFQDKNSSSYMNSFQTGVLFNLSKNVGISLNYYYYSGYSIHGMFYNHKENYNGVGIQINY